jgi:rare lipoprotein A (peptidoglycan hydrolase)
MRILYLFFSVILLTACIKPSPHNSHQRFKKDHRITSRSQKQAQSNESFWDIFFFTKRSTQQKRELDSYVAHGKRYKILKSAAGYRERGTASWYGKSFHNRSTSSGERYNMYGMTAAHRTLPLHSYIKVTNVKNGRSVVVRVNDRGPFHSNRLIDLSYAAARGIGLFPAGMALVDIQAVSATQFQNKAVKPIANKIPRTHRHTVQAAKKKLPRQRPIVRKQVVRHHRHAVVLKKVRKAPIKRSNRPHK